MGNLGTLVVKDEDKYAIGDDGQLSFLETLDDTKRYDVDVPAYINKANAFIKRIGKTTLLSEQSFLMAIYKAKERTRSSIEGTALQLKYDRVKELTGTDFSDGLIASFSSSELKKMMNIKTSRYSSEMEKMMNLKVFTNTWHIIYNNNGVMADTACIIGTLYDKSTGRIWIKFNPDIKDKIVNLKNAGGYTMLSTDTMRKVSKDLFTWSAYQLLREEMSYREGVQKKKGLPPKKEYATEFELSEFKFLTTLNQVDLSSIDPSQVACAKLIKENNYEEAEKVLPREDRTYDDNWKGFKNKVLTRACSVINGWEGNGIYEQDDEEYERLCRENHATDIHFRCMPIKSGKGARVVGIRFYIRWDKITDAEIPEPKPETAEVTKHLTEKEDPTKELDMLLKLSEIIGESYRMDEMREILRTSGYDMEKIRVSYMELQQANIEPTINNMLDMLKGAKARNATIDYDFYKEMFPGFTDKELESIVLEARKHAPMGRKEIEKDLWIENYISYYRDKILATSEDTRTTVYRRLLDSVIKDYDGKA